jgi:hypothetical protein
MPRKLKQHTMKCVRYSHIMTSIYCDSCSLFPLVKARLWKGQPNYVFELPIPCQGFQRDWVVLYEKGMIRKLGQKNIDITVSHARG